MYIYTQIFTTVLLSLCCLNNLEMFECLTTLSAFIANVLRLPKKTHYSLRWLIHAMFTTFANSNYAVAAENALNILPRRREG